MEITMKVFLRYILAVAVLSVMLLNYACFPKIVKNQTQYYVLDYLKATERPALIQKDPKPVTLEVYETDVARAYSRNQIVIRSDKFQISYLQSDIWANRLSDAIPNLLVARLRAYNIFKKVDRDTGEADPNYYLDTVVTNLEKILDDPVPRAHLKMEFILRDSKTSQALMSYKADDSRPLPDDSTVYFVQVINELIMEETDIFAARCITFLEGKTLYDVRPDGELSKAEDLYYERIESQQEAYRTGELLINLRSRTNQELYYYYSQRDEVLDISKQTGVFGEVLTLEPGFYTVSLGENQELEFDVEIRQQMRTVVDKPVWSELSIVIIDETRNRVRMGYDIYQKNADDFGYLLYSQAYSVGEDEIAEEDKIWVLPPGDYLIKLGGGYWTDLRDFTTVSMDKGETKTVTMVVDPSGEGTYLIGAGVIDDDGLLARGNKFHRGAVHTNISLSQKNSTAQEDPVNSFNLAAQFDNAVSIQPKSFDYSMRSLYDLGMNLSTGNDFRISLDGWSLKNTLLFTPFTSHTTKNFGFYGRGDLNTHFFDEYLYFSEPRNLVMLDQAGDTLSVDIGDKQLRTKVALYPLRLKEGTGITYRFIFTPNIQLGVRGGYGWQQEYKRRAFTFVETYTSPQDGLTYELYQEENDKIAKGIESTVIFSALNVFKFLTVNSTLDILFPMGSGTKTAKYESNNRFNIRLFRNISIDVKANLIYDKDYKDYLLYDYSTFLRLSLFY